jgi:serine/threonine protein phosphatase PrpC
VIDIHERNIRTFHVGDTAMMVIGGRGKIKLQSISHSPVGYLQEMGMISEQEAMHHVDRHLISNVIGCDAMRIEIGPSIRLAPQDTVIVASDGLWDNLYVSEIAEYATTRPLIDAVSLMVNSALERMTKDDGHLPSKPDDLTIVAFRPVRRGTPGPRADIP